jgi:hypothetical protein
MATIKIDELQHADVLDRLKMARVVGGSGKEPAGKPTHIDVKPNGDNVLTYGDGSKWTMDLGGTLHPL